LPSNLPSVAVIIPTLNAGRMLGEALRSLSEQTVACETLLIDGGSSDDTIAVASAAAGIRVISAPGTSIYEAINRGIAASRASAVCLLNADDALLPGALAAFAEALAQNPRAGIVRGWPCFVERGTGGAVVSRADEDRRTHRPLTLELLLRGPCAINSLCVRRATFDRIGTFDTSLRLAADREWMLRARCAGVGIAEIDRRVYQYLMHDGSKTLDRGRRNYAAIRREHLAIVARYMDYTATRAEPPVVSALLRWHAAEVAMLSVSLLRSRAWREATSVMGEAFRSRPLWPAALATDILLHMKARAGA
jgi:glycosyltransferase involved in cell wall biosynthesis